MLLPYTHTCSYLWCCSVRSSMELAEHRVWSCTVHLPTAAAAGIPRPYPRHPPHVVTLLSPVPYTISSMVSSTVPPHYPPATTVAHTRYSCGHLEQSQPAGQTQAVRDHLVTGTISSSSGRTRSSTYSDDAARFGTRWRSVRVSLGDCETSLSPHSSWSMHGTVGAASQSDDWSAAFAGAAQLPGRAGCSARSRHPGREL